jgi:transcriptional regulator with XRE-family HTH domain
LAAFGRNVAKVRAERGLSQDKLAEQANLDRTYVSGIERGVRNPESKSSCASRAACANYQD